MVPGGELVVVGVVVLAAVVLGTSLLRRALRRRRDGWYGDGPGPAADTRGAVGRSSWMLGGGGGGGGG